MTRRGHGRYKTFDIQWDQGSQVEHLRRYANLVEFSRGCEAEMHCSTPRDECHVCPAANCARLTKRERCCVWCDRTSNAAVEPLRLDKKHWVRVPNCHAQHLPRVVRKCWADNLDPRRLNELRLDR